MFGATGKQLSVFGYGGSRYKNKDEFAKNVENVRYAYSKGINHFDSCPGYANSEELFSQALCDFKRSTYYMSTKNQPYYINSKEQAKDGIKYSLEKMKLDYFDFYYLWNVKRKDEYEKAINISQHYEALLEAREEGIIHHICMSSHLTGQETIEIINDGKIEGVLLNLNILNFPYTIEAAFHAKRKGIGIGVMSPLYGGLIPQNADKLMFLCRNGLSPTNYALSFINGC